MKPLYDELFPISSNNELDKINNLETMLLFVNVTLINEKNLIYIIDQIDRVYKANDKLKLFNFLDCLDEKYIDFFSKKSKILSKYKNADKEEFYQKYKDNLQTDDINSIRQFIKNINSSFEDLENKAILLFSGKVISEKEYADFVNSLPNISESTFNYLNLDECVFQINENLINKMYLNKNYYGYIKYKIISEGKIPNTNDKHLIREFENIYSNKSGIFDKYLKNDEKTLSYFRDNEIYKKYNSTYLDVMAYCEQNDKLLSYIFANIEDIEQLKDYIVHIRKIKCPDDKLLIIINNNREKISLLSEESINNLIKCITNKKIKSKVYYIRKKILINN